MKPIVFYINETNQKEGKIVLSKEAFEDMLERAYQQGRADGASQIITTPCPPPPTLTTPPYSIPTITCKAADGNKQFTSDIEIKNYKVQGY